MSRIGIDMLDVGKGDAYVIELQDEQGQKFVFVIDGGTSESSGALVSHIQSFHNGNVGLAICTHPDTDHIGGLIQLLQNCNVAHLFLNDPRDIISEETLLQKARQNLSTEEVIVFKSALERIDDLKAEAAAQNTDHHQTTFAANTPRFTFGGWDVFVLGPSQRLFKDIWLNDDVVRDWFNSDTVDALVGALPRNTTLDDPAIDTKPVNNSSIIILIEGYGRKYLFTGDAGKRALRDAMTIKDISNLTWLDVPHHGSRRNLDSSIINYLSPEVAFISSPGTTKHPRRAVIRALQSRRTQVYSTCKHGHVYHQFNLPRIGWNSIDPWELI
jgi:beta-lactamase superfamily II metal-dependent hydrolase